MRRVHFACVISLACVLLPASTPAQAAVAGVVVESPDDILGLPSRLVFSTVNEEVRPAKLLTLRNTTSSTLKVSGIGISGPQAAKFRLSTGQSTAFSIAPGSSADVSVEFRPPAEAEVENYASLTIAFGTAGTVTVALAGLDALDYEGGKEPRLAHIARVLGYSTNIGFTKNKSATTRVPVGDEIISPYWQRVDSSKPVHLYPLANYSGRKTTSTGRSGWYAEGSTTKHVLYAFPGGSDPSGGENQRLLPKINDGGTTAFSPIGTFGIFANGDWSDDGRNGSAKVHNFRFYPAKGPNGVQIPNAWFVGSDIGSDTTSTTKNYDYQDEVYLLTNSAPKLTSAPMPSSTLGSDFSAEVPGTVVDKDGQGTGFTGVQKNAAGTEHDPSRIDLVPAQGVLRLTSTAGTNSKAANSQRNALELGFDGSRSNFQAETRVLGPLNQLTTDFQHQALYMGPDLENFLKIEAEHRNGGVSIVLYFEQKGTGTIPATPISIPAGTISTLDLFLTGNVAAGTITASYRLNSDDPAEIINVSPSSAPADVMRWFSTQARAGILVSNQGNATPFTGSFDRFGIRPA